MKQFFKNVFASTFGVLIGVTIMVSVAVFGLFVSIASSSGDSEYKPKKNTVFKLSLDGEIVENNVTNPFLELMGEKESLSLSKILRSIRVAKENDNIKGIYLEMGQTSVSPATASAIRDALGEFKESGKFIVSYSDAYTQGGYYIASMADSVFVNPLGNIYLTGLSSIGIFYPELAEKVGVKYEIFKVGTFKGAVEPYFLKKYSDANREQITSFQQSIWKNMTSAILQSRRISEERLNEFINDGHFIDKAETALEYQLVDAIRYRYEAENAVKALAGQAEEDKFKTADVSQMSRIKDKTKVKEDKIAILYAEGIIQESSGSSSFGMDEQTISEKMVDEFRKLNDDDEVKAVVFRVNSRGGSAYISEQIWKQVYELKQKKPVVVSMGSYAASGGYYISCAANQIVAEPTTLTGSIGVYGIIPNFTGTAEKIGVTTDVVKTNELADLGNLTRPMTDQEKALIQANVERTYDLFLTRCAEGRGMTKEEIDFIAQGRVWTGEQALERGLVDKLGNVGTAIETAAELAELEDYSVFAYNANKDFFTELLEKQLDEMKINLIKNTLGEKFELFKVLYNAKPQEGIQALSPIELQGM
ncbi:signal peptide peptidase SppA [Massilibacteroides sp.]|uniref:signal peptide peptidase SppA n=1 Tax=Massilibacteroides sp. TaxID=2034766 RepID=UPI002630DFCB|nr:signal peptide peptidase SppA [Massilibacteroides sp.]MDD4516103.1 signal peptide peptidase SppA [Massilibacteroides sp.]